MQCDCCASLVCLFFSIAGFSRDCTATYYPECAAMTQATAGVKDGVPAQLQLAGCLCQTLQQSQESIKGDAFKEKVQLPFHHAALFAIARLFRFPQINTLCVKYN